MKTSLKFVVKKYFILFILVAFTKASFAQAILNGKVLDKENKAPIEFASVVLKNNKDSSKFYGTKTDQNGNFSIHNIPFGTYKFQISYLGYELYEMPLLQFSSASSVMNLKSIFLEKAKKELGETVVQGQKEAVVVEAGKKVFNVSQNLSSAGGTLGDVLRNVPGVSVNTSGDVSLRGKTSVTILIDGKPNAQFGDMATALASIPANTIERVEVITNPSAKYDAQGMGGIINIVLKNVKKKTGWSGSVNAGLHYNFKTNAGFQLNYRANQNLALFANANTNYSDVWEINEYNRKVENTGDTYLSQSIKYRQPLRNAFGFGLEWNLNEKNTITWTNSFFRGIMKGDDSTYIYKGINYTNNYETWMRNNIYTAFPQSNSTEIKFNHRFKKPKQELVASLNLSSRRYIRESAYVTHVFDSNYFLINSFIQKNPIEGGNINGTFQVDYTHPLTQDSKLEFGIRSYAINFKSENFPTIQYLNQSEIEESILKNDFRYTQQNNAVYSTYTTKIKDYAIQLGLRFENFIYKGTAAQLNNQQFTTSFNSFFPSLFVSKKLNTKNDLSFSYSRRVNRPNFFQMIPFVRVNSPLDTSIGNPSIRPEFIHIFELSHTLAYGHNSQLLTSFYYQYTQDLIQNYKRFNSDGSTFSQVQNLLSGRTYGFEITNQWYVTKTWDLMLNVNAFKNILNGQNVDSTNLFSGNGAFVKLINNNNLGKNWSTQISANYFAPKIIYQGKNKAYGFADFSVKKSFLDKQLVCTFIASDIFNTLKTTTVYNQIPGMTQNVYENEQTQFWGINIQYNFPANTKQGTMHRGRAKEKETKSRDENLKSKDGGDE